jgi:hypothetical protein
MNNLVNSTQTAPQWLQNPLRGVIKHTPEVSAASEKHYNNQRSMKAVALPFEHVAHFFNRSKHNLGNFI